VYTPGTVTAPVTYTTTAEAVVVVGKMATDEAVVEAEWVAKGS
jgi:hypothetical protein